MNTLFMPASVLAMTEASGGLFDFNATLPLMAIQFILLTVVLTFLFYKPVSKVIDERETYITGNLSQASEKVFDPQNAIATHRSLSGHPKLMDSLSRPVPRGSTED